MPQRNVDEFWDKFTTKYPGKRKHNRERFSVLTSTKAKSTVSYQQMYMPQPKLHNPQQDSYMDKLREDPMNKLQPTAKQPWNLLQKNAGDRT